MLYRPRSVCPPGPAGLGLMRCRLMAEGASYELTEKSLAPAWQKKIIIKKKAAVTD